MSKVSSFWEGLSYGAGECLAFVVHRSVLIQAPQFCRLTLFARGARRIRSSWSSSRLQHQQHQPAVGSRCIPPKSLCGYWVSVDLSPASRFGQERCSEGTVSVSRARSREASPPPHAPEWGLWPPRCLVAQEAQFVTIRHFDSSSTSILTSRCRAL